MEPECSSKTKKHRRRSSITAHITEYEGSRSNKPVNLQKVKETLTSIDGLRYIKNKTEEMNERLLALQKDHKRKMEELYGSFNSNEEDFNFANMKNGKNKIKNEHNHKTSQDEEQNRLLKKAIDFRKLLESLDDIGDQSSFSYYQPITDELVQSMHTLQDEHKDKMQQLLNDMDDSDEKNKSDALSMQSLLNTVCDVQNETSVNEKKQWVIGSRVEIYSNSENKWLSGSIIRIFEDAEGEWLVVKYSDNRMKEIQRYSDGIRPPKRDLFDWMEENEIDHILDEIDDRNGDQHYRSMINSVSILSKCQENGLYRMYQENKSKYYSFLVNQYKLNGQAIEEITAKFKYLDIMKSNIHIE